MIFVDYTKQVSLDELLSLFGIKELPHGLLNLWYLTTNISNGAKVGGWEKKLVCFDCYDVKKNTCEFKEGVRVAYYEKDMVSSCEIAHKSRCSLSHAK